MQGNTRKVKWWYKTTSKLRVAHAFEFPSYRMSACGERKITLEADKWKCDTEGLSLRRGCNRCRKILGL